MVNRCVVYGCGNEPKEKVTLHEFPSAARDQKLREKWKSFVCRTRKHWAGPTTNSHICSVHFADDSFENKLRMDMGMAKKLVLKRGAKPTIYPEGTCRTLATTTSTHGTSSAVRKREVLRLLSHSQVN